MSDKGLVELIRSAPWSDGFPYLKETADRIEELEAERDALDRIRREAREAALREAGDAVEDYCSDMPDLAGHGHSAGLRDAILALIEKDKS